jgi:hypothetical protein
MTKDSYVPFKKPGTLTTYTDTELYDLSVCSSDAGYFVEKFVKIRHPKHGIIPFNMYPYQRNLIKNIDNYKNICLLWSRQLGKTEIVASYLLWYAMFNPGKTVLVVANKLSQAIEIMDRIRFAYQELPDYIRDSATEFNKSSMAFSNGSKIVCRATTADAGRGLSVSLLYVDEMAFLRSAAIMKEFWAAISPVLSTGGRCIITSTPNNDQDIFAQIWNGACDTIDEFGNTTDIGSNGFKGFKAIWSDHPERDEEWARAERAKIGDDARFDREHCCLFVSADNTLINPYALTRLKPREPLYTTGAVRWFKKIDTEKSYYVSLDPSTGVGKDYAAIQIFEMPGMEQVGEWLHNKTPPKGQIQTILNILRYINSELKHNDPEIYWSFENNNCGEAILALILEVGEDRFPGNLINEPKMTGHVKKVKRGLATTHKSKLLACTKFKSLIDSDKMKLHSTGLIYQLKNFVASGVSFEGKPGVNDDLVASTLGIVRLWLITQEWGAWNADIMKETFDEEYEEPPMPLISVF